MSDSVLEAPARPELANYVGGEWTPARSGRTYEKRNPANPAEVVGEFPASGEEDVVAAVEAAAEAFPAWSALPAAARAAVLMRAANAIEARVEEMAADMTREMGKPLREARMESARTAAIFRYFAGEAGRPKGELYEQSATGSSLYTLRRPLGVVGLITPWNFPAAIPAWKMAPALVYGNTVVLKLAQEAPLTGLHLAAALDEAGIPAGVLNVVIGRGSEVGTPLVMHPQVRAISFTGSVAVGHLVRDQATALGKRVQLELGGHNPLIVAADADLGRAVEAAYAGAFWSAGQKCTATRRIYVAAPVYDEFRQRLLARIDERQGRRSGRSRDRGRPAREREADERRPRRDRAGEARRRQSACRRRAHRRRVVPRRADTVRGCGGQRDALVRRGLRSRYVALPIRTLDEAIERANAVEFGLSASIFTNSLQATQEFVKRAEAGMLHVNSQTAGADVHVPFGGIKASGFGPHEQGPAAVEFYTEIVTVYQDV